MLKSSVFYFLIFFCFIGCTGDDGRDGMMGPEGFSSLVSVTTLADKDENCPTGGSRVDTGIDNGDGEGTAGNGILEEGEIDQTAFICNGADGADNPTLTSPRLIDHFSFDGFEGIPRKAVEGFTTVAISDRYPDSNEPQTRTRIGMRVIKALDSVSRVRSLVRFGGLRQRLIEAVDARYDSAFSKGILLDRQILGATLYVESGSSFPFVERSGALNDLDFFQFGPISMSSKSDIFPFVITDDSVYDDYDASTVTWNEISPGVAWRTPGLFNTDRVDGKKDDVQLVPNYTNIFTKWYAFRLDTATIEAGWLRDNINRGFLLALNEQFILEQGEDVDIMLAIDRMVLDIEIVLRDETPSGGRVEQLGESFYKPWEARTQAERFTPLNQHLYEDDISRSK